MPTQVQIQGLGQFGRRGFTLEHLGCEVVLLLHEGELVGRFSQIGATEESIQRECAQHLAKCHGWEGRLWSSRK